jgi:hypothetical protein
VFVLSGGWERYFSFIWDSILEVIRDIWFRGTLWWLGWRIDCLSGGVVSFLLVVVLFCLSLFWPLFLSMLFPFSKLPQALFPLLNRF